MKLKFKCGYFSCLFSEIEEIGISDGERQVEGKVLPVPSIIIHLKSGKTAQTNFQDASERDAVYKRLDIEWDEYLEG